VLDELQLAYDANNVAVRELNKREDAGKRPPFAEWSNDSDRLGEHAFSFDPKIEVRACIIHI
jgi:hypothetical protein